MKNIEFYYDELLTSTSFYHFCLKYGMDNSLYDGDYQNVIKWLNEEHPILDDVKKRYLGNLLRPLNTEKTFIRKRDTADGLEYIAICCLGRPDGCLESFCLPPFEIGTMYKGMETDKRYTLEELGL